MKKIILLLIPLMFVFFSCVKNVKKTQTLKNDKEIVSETKREQKDTFINANVKQESNPQLNDLFKTSKDLLEPADTKKTDVTQFDTSTILDLLAASGVSREEMEKLIKDPEKLKRLAQQAIKGREQAKQDEPVLNGKLSKAQLISKDTPTGISLEEAILMVQAESGPEATMAKLKKIDSLAGTNIMQQLNLSEAKQVLTDLERKNEVKVSPKEEQIIKDLRAKSGQMHSEKEAKELLAELEKTEKDISSGKIKVSPRFKNTIKHQKNTVTIFHNAIVRKSSVAKSKFRQLNPDLYFGDDVGQTYIGMKATAVYLPLGELSFADEVVSVQHPQLMINEVKNVIGIPDKIETFDNVTGIYSLGLGGELTVRFIDNALTNVNGPDLYIFEIGQIEPTDLEISKDGINWIKVGKIDGGVAEVDIAEFVKQGELFYYVRLKDLKKESALPGADVDAIAAIGAAMRLNLDSKLLFDTGKSELKPAGKEALKKLAKSIEILKKGNVIVEGHTDDVGSDNTNQKLSLARAKSVSEALKKIIPSQKFTWQEKGLGDTKPLVENNSDLNRSKNRRVEILVLPN
ncbi:OmpA family protein [Polaribacter sp.]|uniref:OmpA family protein n=1 Tax=Polaribacter sp. TaxID=1920175 RepID=UPI003EF702E4